MKRILPRRGLQHHVWMTIIRMLESKSASWPQVIHRLPAGKLRTDAEILVAAELVNCAKAGLLAAKRRNDHPWVYAAEKTARDDPSLATQLEAYHWCSSLCSGIRVRLHEMERRALREGHFSESPAEGYSNETVHFYALEADVHPMEHDKAAEWISGELQSPSHRLRDTEHARDDCAEQIKNSLQLNGVPLERPVEPHQSDLFRVIGDFANSEPAAGLKTDELWWSGVLRRLSLRLEKDCRNKGHHLVLRFVSPKKGGLWDDEIKIGDPSDMELEDIYNKEYVRPNGWFGWNDFTQGKKTPKRHWNLPQLRQLLRRQDSLVDAWFAKRDALDHPLYPGYRYTDAYDHWLKVNDAQTRLFWLLKRSNLPDTRISDWGRATLFQRGGYSRQRFVSVIMAYEQELIRDYPSLIKAERLKEVERLLAPA